VDRRRPEYRVVYKTGAVAPSNETDGTQVTLGAVTSTNVSGLAAATQYTFKIFSKLAGQSVFSVSGPTSTITTTSPPAATRHVNAATGVNTGICSSAGSPCKTITYAMGQATAGNPGDIVSVAPGTYNVALGEIFPITFKAGVQLVATGNPSNTIIDGAGDTVKKGLMKSQSNNSPVARIDGFTFRNGLSHDFEHTCPSSLGGALYISSSSANFTVSRNVFDSNEARGYSADGSFGQTGCLAWGGAIYVFSSTVTIVNNVFTNNIARGGNGFSHPGSLLTGNENGSGGEGGAINMGGSGSIMNNTFYGNAAVGGNGGTASNGTGYGGSGTGGAISAAGKPRAGRCQQHLLGKRRLLRFRPVGSHRPVDRPGRARGQLAFDPQQLLFGNMIDFTPSSTGDTPSAFSVTLDPQFHAVPSEPAFAHWVAGQQCRRGRGRKRQCADDGPGRGRKDPHAVHRRIRGLARRDDGGGDFKRESLSARPVRHVHGRRRHGQQRRRYRQRDVQGRRNDDLQFRRPRRRHGAVRDGCAFHGFALDHGGIRGNATYAASTSPAVTQQVVVSDPPRLANISTRGQVQTGFDVMIGGFAISGSAAKTVVVRAIGPSLASYGVPGSLPNPQLQIVRQSDGTTIATNDDWQSHANAAQVQAAGFAPAHPLESAIYITLPPGLYTAVVSGTGGVSGVGLVEVYEVDQPAVPLINISTRGKVQTGSDVMIGGFVVFGSGTQTVIIRAIGPSLTKLRGHGRAREPDDPARAHLRQYRHRQQRRLARRAQRGPDPGGGAGPGAPPGIGDHDDVEPGRLHGGRFGRERRLGCRVGRGLHRRTLNRPGQALGRSPRLNLVLFVQTPESWIIESFPREGRYFFFLFIVPRSG
jgi:hypothetical protein